MLRARANGETFVSATMCLHIVSSFARAFIYSGFVNPGSYSCAVDAFLEVSTHNLPARNEFTDPLFNACSDYICPRQDN